MFDKTVVNLKREPDYVDSPLPVVDESRFTTPPNPGAPLREPNKEWVESTLAGMTLEEKIGQLLMTSQNASPERQVGEHHVGGFIFIGNGQSAAAVVAEVNRLQAISRIPLWFGIDSEAGVGARIADATMLPMLMAFGAADDPSLMEAAGRITARESQALGLQVTFGPVLDVNTEPRNPIVSTRSCSDSPDRVARNAAAFVRGARAEGVLCTFKHYPGHGASAGDSHSMLPSIDATMEELEEIHLRPYRELIAESEVDMVMTSHLWFPAVHPETPWPATLSSTFNTSILREQLGFDGLIVSDAIEMTGVAQAVPDLSERAVRAVEAGVDIIIGTEDLGAAARGIHDAVESGRLSPDLIDRSTRRVLTAKSRAGLPERRFVSPDAWRNVLNSPVHREIVREVCRRAITWAKNDLGAGAVLSPGENIHVVTLLGSQKIFYRFPATPFHAILDAAIPGLTKHVVSQVATEADVEQIALATAGADKIVVLGYDWYAIHPANQVAMVNRLTEGPAPVIYVGFGAPYHLLQIPGVAAFLCGYATIAAMQETAAEVLLGRRIAPGALPVSLYPSMSPA